MMIHLYLAKQPGFISDKISYIDNWVWWGGPGKDELMRKDTKILIYCVPSNYPEDLKKLYGEQILNILKNNRYNIRIICSDDYQPYINKLINHIDGKINELEIYKLQSENNKLQLEIESLKNKINYLELKNKLVENNSKQNLNENQQLDKNN